MHITTSNGNIHFKTEESNDNLYIVPETDRDRKAIEKLVNNESYIITYAKGHMGLWLYIYIEVTIEGGYIGHELEYPLKMNKWGEFKPLYKKLGEE